MMNYTIHVPLIAQCDLKRERIAVIDSDGPFRYCDLLETSSRVASALLTGHDDLQEARIAFSVIPGFAWVATQWGIWRAGGVAVPLPLNSPRPELEYFINDCRASMIVCDALALPEVSPIA